MKRMSFYGNAAYDVTGKEMDKLYPRCSHCMACAATCMHYKNLADLSDEEWEEYRNVSWCTKPNSEGR